MAIEALGRFLILIGVISIAIGALFVIFSKVPWLGKLPGDIIIQRNGFTFYFPIITMILISIILTILFNLIGRR